MTTQDQQTLDTTADTKIDEADRCDTCSAYGITTMATLESVDVHTQFAGSFLTYPRRLRFCAECDAQDESLTTTAI